MTFQKCTLLAVIMSSSLPLAAQDTLTFEPGLYDTMFQVSVMGSVFLEDSALQCLTESDNTFSQDRLKEMMGSDASCNVSDVNQGEGKMSVDAMCTIPSMNATLAGRPNVVYTKNSAFVDFVGEMKSGEMVLPVEIKAKATQVSAICNDLQPSSD